MGDARHKRRFPDGDRVQMTPEWKLLVRRRLKDNKRDDIYPHDQVELAEAVGASDKSAITKMFQAASSKLVPKVCEALQIPPPMRVHDPDELELFVERIPADRRERALSILRLAVPDDDDPNGV